MARSGARGPSPGRRNLRGPDHRGGSSCPGSALIGSARRPARDRPARRARPRRRDEPASGGDRQRDWVAVALAFGAVLLLAGERADAEAFLAGYLVEKSLSLDNVFVFLLVFTAFGLPDAERHRLLSYGIVAALALRVVFIVVGAAALRRVRVAGASSSPPS